MLIPGALGVDVISQIKEIEYKANLYVVDKTIDELENIVKTQKKKHRESAKLGLLMIKKFKLNIIKTTQTFKNVDEIIVDIVKNEGFGVATQDLGLKRRIKEYNAPLFVLRQKKYVLRVK